MTLAHCAALDAEQVAAYRRDGFVLIPGVLTPEELAALRAESDRLLDLTVNASIALGENSPRMDVCRRGEAISLRKVQPLGDISPLIGGVLVDERLLAPLRSILDCDPVPMEEKLNYKQLLRGDLPIDAEREGDSFDLHCDWSYFDHNGYPRESLSVAVAIDDATTDNGCMRVLPGSHTREWPIQAAYNPLLVEGVVDGADLLHVPQPAGSALIFHCGLVHGSGDNRTALPRRLLIFSYHPAWHVTEPDKRNRSLRDAGQAHEARYRALLDRGHRPRPLADLTLG
ncbi:MAG TPA: phytanoyl-CoA dioxygenase family protein [Candidatus Dormibacteraeota bacterium]|nr:phytanoyl-CoA dioxygenase family protein [Candidatus Dormibacteraeota bacterium]